MKQIALILAAVVIGLGFGYVTGGLAFSPAVCVVAGVFLVTPSLFKFNIADVAIIKSNWPSIFKNLWVNYLLLTTVSLGIGFASNDIGIAAALFLLALLPGGGMVMMWIKQSGANVKLGFVIFMLNLALLLPVMLIFDQFQRVAGGWFPDPNLTGVSDMVAGLNINPIAPFMVLIVFPFLLSRLALDYFPKVVEFTGKHQQLISKATMFGIVVYLFSLSTSQLLFQVPAVDLLKAFVATAAFYGVAIAAAILTTDLSPDGQSVFWHIATRYITLALILAVLSVDTYGATFILPIMFAYFIQIGAAGFLARREA